MQLGLKGVFGQAYNEHPMQCNQIFDMVTSTKAYEVYQEIEGLSAVSTATDEGSSLDYDSFGQSFNPKVVPLTYRRGISVSEEALEDELYGIFAKKTKALGFAMAQGKEIVHALMLDRAFTSTYTMSGGDGKEMCATDHSLGPHGGTYSNELTIGADLTETSLESMLNQIGAAVDSRGNKIAIKPKALIIGVNNQFNAFRITKSALQNDTSDNAINAINSMGVIPKIIVSNYITDDGKWFIKTDVQDGLVSVQRKAVEFAEDNSFNTGAMRYKARERYAPAWINPRGIYGSTGA